MNVSTTHKPCLRAFQIEQGIPHEVLAQSKMQTKGLKLKRTVKKKK